MQPHNRHPVVTNPDNCVSGTLAGIRLLSHYTRQ